MYSGLNDWALQVANVSKNYHSYQLVHALENINFELKKGNILGLIGDNGAGKSTLLRIMSGLIKPDRGTVSFKGKLSSILDIGSGFHPDLSGHENIYMSGRLMGLSAKQISNVVEDIISFSELQNFIETPLKYYSSGMFLRLAFTTATSFKTDILLLDEIMSVGDLHFQQKSGARILEIVKGGSTVIMAGHNIEALSNLCTHGLWLNGGKQNAFGEINEVIDKYLTHKEFTSQNHILPVNTSIEKEATAEEAESLISEKESEGIKNEEEEIIAQGFIRHFINSSQTSEEKICLLEASVSGKGKNNSTELEMDDELQISVRYRKELDYPVVLYIVVQDKFGHNLMSLCSHRIINTSSFIDNTSAGIYSHVVDIPKGLFNHGIFSVSFFFADEHDKDLAEFKRILFFKIHKTNFSFKIFNYKGNFPGSLLPFFNWQSKKET